MGLKPEVEGCLPGIVVVYALLMPASATLGEDASDFQSTFEEWRATPGAEHAHQETTSTSQQIWRRGGAYLNALKIAKLLLTSVGFGHITRPLMTRPRVLQSALQNIPQPCRQNGMLRNVAIRLAQQDF
ncbi:unnamed protein product [Pleuronectes platessa]|uniref:Uncharacterized protein n=1 Tax=Pleuronectes platessa TaxID=8262 RepID=A0A9N7YN18_PLEPL|nr:unnamed protein product [Pleuronectes platessa]